MLELGDGERLRIAAAGFGGGDALLADGFEFAIGEGGFAKDLGGEAERAGKVGFHGFDAGAGAGGAAGDTDVRLEAIHLVLDLLAGMVLGAAHEHAAGDAGSGGLAEEGLLIAVADGERRRRRCRRGFCARAGTSSCRRAGCCGRTRDSMLDGLGSKASPAATTAEPLKSLNVGGDIGGGRNFGAVRALGGDEGGEGAVGFLQVGLGDAEDIGFGVTALMRSRMRNMRRQSPCE